MLPRRTTLILLLALFATSLGWWLSRAPESTLARAEAAVWDRLTVHGRKAPVHPKIVFLGIDKDSVGLEAGTDLKDLFGIDDATTPEAGALKSMSNGWPWPRSVYALMLDRLIGAGAKTVVFDLNFPTPSDDDELFRRALERYADRVVIGSNFVATSREGGAGLDAGLTIPSPSLIPVGDRPDSRVGFVNFWPDADGVIRHAQFQLHFGQFLGTGRIKGEPVYASLAAQAVRKFGRADLVPADPGQHAFRYAAPPGAGFPHRSIFEIFVPEYWERNFRSGEFFDGALVIIGAVENWQHDEHQTPFGTMPGPEIQANAVNALLHGEFVKPVPWPAALAIWIFAGAIAALAGIFCASPAWRIGMSFVVAGAWCALQLPLFDRAGLLAPVVGPLAVLGVTGLFTLIYDLIRAGAEQLRLRLHLIERKRAQEALESMNAELERRVAERTAELTTANTQLTGLVEEKNVLLKEVHHRVKNNLQIISSLLNLQSSHIEDPAARAIFDESRGRVRSMALIHEKLYQSHDLAKVDFQDYLKVLTNGLQTSYSSSSRVRMSVAVDEIMLGVDSAVPCGLIVNELVTNCFKYAFGDRPGEINISMKRIPDSRLQLTVSDNGVGFPKDVDIRNTESLGMQLVTTLADQLDGTLAMRNGCGTTFEISFPEAITNPS